MSSAALRTVLTITGGVLFGWSARQIVRRQLEEELRRVRHITSLFVSIDLRCFKTLR